VTVRIFTEPQQFHQRQESRVDADSTHGLRRLRQIYCAKLTQMRQKVHPIEVVIPRSFFGALTGGRVS
jgi:hypothetical protein